MKRLIRFGCALAAVVFSACSLQAVSVSFNLRDTGATVEIEGGVIKRPIPDVIVIATLTPIVDGSTGSLNQSGSGFGINASGSDDADQIDGAGDGAESVLISFDRDVFFTELQLSALSNRDPEPDDSGSLRIAGFSLLTLLDTGSGTDVYTFVSNNFVAAGETVLLKHVSGNGFSFDGFTVETVPSHWSAGCSFFFLTGLTGLFGWMRRRESDVTV